MKKILFCLLAFYTPVSIVIAQNTTNSPTSMFGLGELSTGEGGQYAGLGGTGIALRGNNFLNNANPASLTELTEQRFQIDAGIMGAYQIYSQRGASNRSVTGNLNNLSIGCRIMPRCKSVLRSLKLLLNLTKKNYKSVWLNLQAA